MKSTKMKDTPQGDRMLTEHEVAHMMNCSVLTMRKWRLMRQGPAWVKLGSLVRYDRRDVDAYIAAQKVTGSNIHTA